MSHLVCLIRGRSFFGGGRRDFLSTVNERGFQLKTEVNATCLTSNLPDISLARQFIKLNSFICLTYHLSDKLKTRHKSSQMTHKLKVLVSCVRYSSCPYGPLNNIMCFILVSFSWIFWKGFY